jgi:hypothetical protein
MERPLILRLGALLEPCHPRRSVPAGLQTLDFLFTQVTDAGLKELANLKGLQRLYLIDTPVTKAGVAELRKALPICSIIGP